MTFDLLVLAFLDGMAYAALLFLVALGLTLIFGVMRILNVAHGSLYALGGYLAATLGLMVQNQGWSPWMALPMLLVAALIIGVVVGGVLEVALLRRILNKDPILQLLVTFAAFMILEDLQRLVWGTQPIFVSGVVDQFGTADVLGIVYTRYQLFVLPVVAVVAFFALRYFLARTRTGRQVTAVTFNREIAIAMGVNAPRVMLITFVIGAVLGALGGALASPTTSLVPGMGADMIVLSFAVVATAGLGQLGGAAIAAVMIGMARSFCIYLFPELEVLVPYLIMVLVLLVRPQGMFADVEARRV